MDLNSYLSNPIVTALLGAISGIIIALTTKLGEGFINEIYEKRREKRAIKTQASQDITAFVIDGMHKGFKVKAGSEHHIKFRAAEIESIDIEVGRKLGQFLSYWSQYRNFSIGHPSSINTEKMAIDYKNRAQKLGDELLEIAREWND